LITITWLDGKLATNEAGKATGLDQNSGIPTDDGSGNGVGSGVGAGAPVMKAGSYGTLIDGTLQA
jgi:hypothetical protein